MKTEKEIKQMLEMLEDVRDGEAFSFESKLAARNQIAILKWVLK